MTDIVLSDGIADADVVTQTTTKTKRPQKYHVVFINDDFTPMQFVVMVLEDIFHKNHDEALAIMLEVHHYNQGIAGTYNKEIADEKVADTIGLAQLNQFPLQVKLVPADSDDDNGGDEG